MAEMNDNPKPHRRWYQISLRTLLLLVTVVTGLALNGFAALSLWRAVVTGAAAVLRFAGCVPRIVNTTRY